MGSTMSGTKGREVRVGGRCGLVMMPQAVEASYKALAESDCIPRRWQIEGRYGIPIERIQKGEYAGKRFIPLLEQAEERLPEAIQELMRLGQVSLIPLNSTQKNQSYVDWHPHHHSPPVTPPIDPKTAAVPRLDSEVASGAFRFAELFCGIGGFRVGLEALGGRCVFACEIERFTKELYMLNFPEPEVKGDIREVKEEEIPQV